MYGCPYPVLVAMKKVILEWSGGRVAERADNMIRGIHLSVKKGTYSFHNCANQ